MTDLSCSDNAGTDVGTARSSTAGYPGTPRWVKVSGIIALVLVLLVAGMMVASGGHGGGRHNPLRHMHMPSGAAGAPVALGLLAPAAQWIQWA